MSERRQITLPLNKVQAPLFDAQFSDYLKVYPHNAPYGTKGFVLNALSYYTENKFGTVTPGTTSDAFSALKAENDQLRADLENFENAKLSPLKTQLDELKEKLSESENSISTHTTGNTELKAELKNTISENETLREQLLHLTAQFQKYGLVTDKSHPHYHNHMALLDVIQKRIAEGKEDSNLEVFLAFYLVAYKHLSAKERQQEFLTEIKVLS